MVLVKNKGVRQMPSFHFPSKEERQELISQLQIAENQVPASAEK